MALRSRPFRAFVLPSAFCAAVGIGASANGQTPPPLPPVRGPVPAVQRSEPVPARLLGVFDEESGNPIAGVEVMDLATGTSALTTSTGTVLLAFLAPGENSVRIRKLGYGVQEMMVTLSPRDTTPLTIVMKRVTELPAVVTKDAAVHHISPALRAFDERMKHKTTGYFITDSILRREDNRTLANMLIAHAPGVSIAQRSGSANFLLKSPRCTNGGPPDVYIDGVKLAHMPDPRWTQRRNVDPNTIPIDLSQFQVSELGAVEWYPDNATMPAEFSGTSAGCGALMLYTRER